MIKKTQILLADDEMLIREGIKAILNQEENLMISFEASNGLEILNFLNSSNPFPDIILMDIKMPLLNGIEATKKITELYPEIKIIALSSYNSEIFMKNVLEVGAVCFVPKSASPTEMITSINLVMKNGFHYSDDLMKFVFENKGSDRYYFKNDYLTQREIEVLKLICTQFSSMEIGEKLNISPRTVDGHRNSLLLKTESKSIIGLVVFAIQNDFFNPHFDFQF